MPAIQFTLAVQLLLYSPCGTILYNQDLNQDESYVYQVNVGTTTSATTMMRASNQADSLLVPLVEKGLHEGRRGANLGSGCDPSGAAGVSESAGTEVSE